MQVRDRTLTPDMFAEFPLDMSQCVKSLSCTAKLLHFSQVPLALCIHSPAHPPG
jgi:hypothetical protein